MFWIVDIHCFFSSSRFYRLMLLSSIYLMTTYFLELLKFIFLSWSFALFFVNILNFINSRNNFLDCCFMRKVFYNWNKMLKSEFSKQILTIFLRLLFVLFTVLVQKTTITTAIRKGSKGCLYVYNTKCIY